MKRKRQIHKQKLNNEVPSRESCLNARPNYSNNSIFSFQRNSCHRRHRRCTYLIKGIKYIQHRVTEEIYWIQNYISEEACILKQGHWCSSFCRRKHHHSWTTSNRTKITNRNTISIWDIKLRRIFGECRCDFKGKILPWGTTQEKSNE